VAHFRVDHDGGSSTLPGEESGLRGYVVVPQIVVNHLEAPNEFAGGSAKSDNGICPLIVASTNSAEIIWAGATGGNKYEVMFQIDGKG
jgi:hypothetical protein